MDAEIQENTIDDNVDDQIQTCLNLSVPKSFFLYAGAGSGKTRSLVNVLLKFKDENGFALRVNRQQVAIITYTNAACDEIKDRLEYDSLFSVSTIHSFVWELIKNYQNDIREWLKVDLAKDIAELEEQQSKGRPGTKTAIDRERKIAAKVDRLKGLGGIKKFIYNPNGDNRTKDSLNHTEVIQIAADFLSGKPLMQEILCRKFPVLLIDESQDTKRELIDALFAVQKSHTSNFSLGLFGDTMQRIYGDGKEDLGRDLPKDWLRPIKKMNHRCPKRIIKLINKIRVGVDGQEQLPRSDKEEGFIRFFIVPSSMPDKSVVEKSIAKKMSELTGDLSWSEPQADVKTLVLEHHMAARRLGFLRLFESLYEIEEMRTSLLDGSLSGLRLFTNLILPIVEAKKHKDEFLVARIVRENSPLLNENFLTGTGPNFETIQNANTAVISLYSLWDEGKVPNLLTILQNVSKSGLFVIPEKLIPIARRTESENQLATVPSSEDDDQDEVINAWDQALLVPFDQIKAYAAYVLDKSNFGTHQGVKGREFPRVMVILDDEEARGFLFSYEKILGSKEPTVTDIKNKKEGKETGFDRTLRLFYVACSRAEKSLAIVEYTEQPELVKKYVLGQQWFDPSEIEVYHSQSSVPMN